MTGQTEKQKRTQSGQGGLPNGLSLQEREQVAAELRHWVRLTSRCNNRCLFCLDSGLQDGSVLSMAHVRRDLEQGRQRGAGRVVLSGGEPTIHPKFVDIVSLARSLGYDWIQVVTNGRMFAYRSFLQDCLSAGLSEVTFSMPAAEPKMYARLTGTPGAFAQALSGLRHALESSGLVVSVDLVVNKINLAVLPDIMAFYLDMGVREFDLLQVVPFGRAFEFKEQLLFEPDEDASHLVHGAIDLARSRGAVVWTNRMDPVLLEGMEEYIQDPHKLADEVYGRRRQLAVFAEGGDMPCEHPDRCPHCFLHGYCSHLRKVRDAVITGRVGAAETHSRRLWLRWVAQPRSEEGGRRTNAADLDWARDAHPVRQGDRVLFGDMAGPSLPKILRNIAGRWISVHAEGAGRLLRRMASRSDGGVFGHWILSLRGPLEEALPDLLSHLAGMFVEGAPSEVLHRGDRRFVLEQMRFESGLTEGEASLLVDWYRGMSEAVTNHRDATLSGSNQHNSLPVFVLTLGLVPVTTACWMISRLPPGAVRLAWPEVDSVIRLDRMEQSGQGPMEWLRDWMHQVGRKAGRDGVCNAAFEDIPSCLIGGEIALPAPLWVSLRCLDDGRRLLPDCLVEDYLRQAYRVWSGRCALCPARSRCPGLSIHMARKYGLGILDPRSVEP